MLFFVFCLTGFLSGHVIAKETQVEILKDMYITGFLSGAPEQKLHMSYVVSKYEAKLYFFLPAGADSDTVRIWFEDGAEKAEAVSEEKYVVIAGEKYYSGDELKLPKTMGRFLLLQEPGKWKSV